MSLNSKAEHLDDEFNLNGDGEHPDFPRSEWREAVETQQTLLGYWQWVAYNLYYLS